MFTVPFTPERPLLPVRPCVKCAHFIAADKTCRLYGNANVVDGSVRYAAASVVRPSMCMEKHYEESTEAGATAVEDTDKSSTDK